ncbi:MAG: hypothetical protein V4667_06940 [Bacteroidota bacterium]
MQKALLLLSFSIVFFSAKAQYTRGEVSNDSSIINSAKAFQKKDFLLTVGLGYPGANSNTKLVFYTKAEYAMHKLFGVGVNYAYESLYFPYGGIVGVNTLLLRGNIHPLTTKKFDLYIGGGIGFHLIKYPTLSNKQNALVGAFDCTIGARYFLAKRIALYSEIGLAKTIIQSGLTYKF